MTNICMYMLKQDKICLIKIHHMWFSFSVSSDDDSDDDDMEYMGLFHSYIKQQASNNWKKNHSSRQAAHGNQDSRGSYLFKRKEEQAGLC